MEMNFAFLEKKQEYELFSGACIDAERILESSPVMSAVASRKALELCVKWIYSIDSALEPIGNREGLQSLLHNNGFPSLMDITLWRRLQHIVRNGNESVRYFKTTERETMQFFLSTYYLILWNGLIIVTEEIMLNEYLMRKRFLMRQRI